MFDKMSREQLLALFNSRSSTRYYDPSKKSVMKIFNVF